MLLIRRMIQPLTRNRNTFKYGPLGLASGVGDRGQGTGDRGET